MPGRQSHGAPPSKKPKPRSNTKKRSMNAFSIASHENPENFKIRQHRLGAQEGGNRPGKRRRDDDDEDEEDEEGESKKQRKGPAKGRFEELDIDHGSDSEGNEWKLGQVDSDDDSDLDSDEAFGESDEERFEGYAFSGSTDKKSKKKSKSRTKDVNLNEDDEMSESDSELEEGDLGEGAVDLATMLDMAEEEEEEEKRLNGKALDKDLSESDDEGSSESDEESSASSADDDDETSDPAKIAALQRMIANLPQADETTRPSKQRSDGASEYNTPSDFGLTSKTKLTLEDLGLPSINDPHIKKSLKFIESDSKGAVKRKGVTAKLAVPLAKRQQDRLDRSAAYEKSKETLDRWTDTVKHNRRADHLMFPLPDHEMTAVKKNDKLVPTNQTKPFNELEATIQSILEESGLATANGKDDEDHLREFEELETKKMSVEEVKARRDQLRMARELMYREEAKSKRIKKIKSRSYRKVHRKQREKEERLNQEALAEGGFVPSEDELEEQDRRRATERMGAKHRGSKWAKATKQIGRAAWDEDARDGITDMARRDEELRKRVEGRAVRKEFEDNSDASLTDSEEDISEDDDAAEQNRLLRQLKKASASELVDESAPGARLSNMKFMRKAEEARKKQNDAMVEDIRRDLVGEESGSEDEEQGDIGRRIFGPNSNKPRETSKTPKLNEFEEREGSDADEDNMDIEIHGLDNDPRNTSGSTRKSTKGSSKKSELAVSRNQPEVSSEGGAWSKVPLKSTVVSEAEAKRRRHKKNNAVDVEELDLSKASVIASKPKPAKKSKPAALEIGSDSDESDDENAVKLPFAIRDQELIKRAFAGADVVGEFEAEKKQTIEDDDDKIIDNTLPGWGAWTGDGVSKREKARNKGRFLTKVEGVKEQNRKDAKLDRVIISERRAKKNSKYLASTLPHPFETRQQYERSLRVPVGPEWTTKETYQEATKPRILLKQGIIAPMSKPLL
ncbi:U3 small nucleolar RNA-associated protein [Lachnellula hyalina]|uniref:U3 small nucleolar RNA-associated protein n=1 Tax=Lachnellula hyalina TaxID=1316788 RepID=A0A8H8TZC9_9HELO|nr:U3 small nucleolar RNA-associated protein [Lachnellula hyalina]TVY27642.1 U3 small nucleolar RNA-associated protein [Lachnellula hyalina]